MGESFVSLSAKYFAEYANSQPDRWSKLLDCRVSHAERGGGRIVDVEQRPGYVPLITIEFDGSEKLARFNPDSFGDGKTFIQAPSRYEALAKWADARAEDDRRRIEQEVHERQALAEKRAREEREKAERQLRDAQERAARFAREKQQRLEQQAREKEEQAAREREGELLVERFGPLCEKFGIHFNLDLIWDGRSLTPLASVLEKLQRKEKPEEFELAWLKDNLQFRLLAIYHYRDYQQNGDLWSLVRTCSFLRKEDLSAKAIELTNKVISENSGITNGRALSALNTTRGGAFRDIGDLESAKISARQAISLSPHNYQPCNLMGAILYQEGLPEQGDVYFEKALQLGAPAQEQDSERTGALRLATPDARKRVMEYLLAKDPEKYAWVHRYQLV